MFLLAVCLGKENYICFIMFCHSKISNVPSLMKSSILLTVHIIILITIVNIKRITGTTNILGSPIIRNIIFYI